MFAFFLLIAQIPYDIEPMYQDASHGLKWYAVGDCTGTHDANTISPWAIGGGYGDVKELTVRKYRYFPQEPRVWHGKNPTIENYVAIDDRSWQWEFAIGTTFTEVASYKGRPFNSRTLTKTATGWEGDEQQIGKRPPGYVEVGNCMDCHADAGKHVTRLRSHFVGREWYGWLRGDDHVFSWRPKITSK